MATKHRGERLSAFLRKRGISYSQLARELAIHRNTVDNWVKKEALAASNIQMVVNLYPDLATVYPELELDPMSTTQDPPESYTSLKDLSDDCQKHINRYRTKLEELQEKYNMVMEKYMTLLESQS